MDKLRIKGPAQLKGEVTISCAKNASLPIMAATLLNEHPLKLKNVLQLRDVSTMLKLLEQLGANVERNEKLDEIMIRTLPHSFEAPYDLVKKMRASVLVLGPLLARTGRARVSLPGGCAIGARPIDIHLAGLEKMGVKLDLQGGYVDAMLEGRPRGAQIELRFPSVTATENLMMCATLAEGKTFLKNAAKEPEIVDLANFLNQQGAKIKGAGGPEITIEGVEKLRPMEEAYQAIPDRIEAITYLVAGALTNSPILIHNVIISHLQEVLDTFLGMGIPLKVIGAKQERRVSIQMGQRQQPFKGFDLVTAIFPGLPTDAQAQLMVLATQAQGPSSIREEIFENRFMHVPELERMGAKICLEGNKAICQGGQFPEGDNTNSLKAAPVMCTDLRASAALVLAALVAEGTTEISRIYHLDRGYEKIHQKLKNLGVEIERIMGEL